ncbi:hypothetical protein BC826DRAFT_482874 [Russula brevipes]|nr:hypothetical protein BC826DRAFT_482874 [Russula brevipes]
MIRGNDPYHSLRCFTRVIPLSTAFLRYIDSIQKKARQIQQVPNPPGTQQCVWIHHITSVITLSARLPRTAPTRMWAWVKVIVTAVSCNINGFRISSTDLEPIGGARPVSCTIRSTSRCSVRCPQHVLRYDNHDRHVLNAVHAKHFQDAPCDDMHVSRSLVDPLFSSRGAYVRV